MTFWTFSSLHFISYLLRFLSLSDNKVFGTRGSNSVRKKDFGPTVSLFKAQSLTDISYQKWKRHVATYWKYEEKKLAEEKRKIIIIIIRTITRGLPISQAMERPNNFFFICWIKLHIHVWVIFNILSSKI